MKTANSLIPNSFSHSYTARKNKRKKRNTREVELFFDRLFKISMTALGNITVTLLAGGVFLGGSYFFFIQLAEYGW